MDQEGSLRRQICDVFDAYGIDLNDGGDGEMRFGVRNSDVIAAVCDLFRAFELDSCGTLVPISKDRIPQTGR